MGNTTKKPSCPLPRTTKVFAEILDAGMQAYLQLQYVVQGLVMQLYGTGVGTGKGIMCQNRDWSSITRSGSGQGLS
jgi:hypothetical protein